MFKLLIALCFSGVICLLFLAARNIANTVPEEQRDFMDPLSKKLKLIWPLVNFFAYYIGPFLSESYLERTKTQLKRAELAYLMGPHQLFGLQIVSALISGLVSLSVIKLFEIGEPIYCLFFFLLGFFLPLMSANDRRKLREKQIVRDLPVYLDFMVMSLEAGLNLSGAIQQSVEKGPAGALNNEFNSVQRDIRAGMSRMEALKQMAERINLKEINHLVTALAQAEKSGGSISETLRIQSDQRRVERFNKAEKLALEAPVKLIFPLVAFIFPCTFIVLFFPIVLKFMAET